MALTPNEAYAAKQPFVDKKTLEHIVEQFPTPFHLYDEAGIRRNMQEVRDAFAWNPGFKEYFAVKANPNPALISILNEYGCGCDCSSYTELMIARSLGITGHDIMFSSNDTPAADFELADKLGAIVNFDDISHIEFFERVAGPIPKTVSCRFNPGGLFQLSNGIMDNPGDSKYGMTTEQLFEAFRMLKAKGAEDFGIHAFLASNTVTNDYYPKLARILFELAVRLERETGAHVAFINLSGGVGIPYLPEQQANDIHAIGEGVHAAYDEILVPAGMGDLHRDGSLYDGPLRLPGHQGHPREADLQGLYRRGRKRRRSDSSCHVWRLPPHYGDGSARRRRQGHSARHEHL